VAVEDDLSDFFDEDEFAIEVTRVRASTADATFLAILGVSDGDALLGRAIAPERRLHWATGPDVLEADTIVVAVTGPMAVHNGSYRVREPRRINDGAESVAELQKVA
jgi:hypothetical protein